jgi:hypothetical protein
MLIDRPGIPTLALACAKLRGPSALRRQSGDADDDGTGVASPPAAAPAAAAAADTAAE